MKETLASLRSLLRTRGRGVKEGPIQTVGDRETSILASRGFLLVLALLTVALLALRAGGFAALSLTMLLVGLCARREAVRGGRELKLSADAPSRPLRVGESSDVTLRLENTSLRPARRTELVMPVPARPCALPAEGLEPAFAHVYDDDGKTADLPLWRCLVGQLPAGSEAEISLRWDAVKRGLLDFGEAAVRTGDRLGLTFCETRPPFAGSAALTVWPRRVPVKTEAFLQSLWDGAAGRRGYAEDPTRLKNVREYREGDNVRRLDQRMLARTGELMIREYETVLPCSIRLLCDVASFGPGEELEEAISVMASLFEDLQVRGIPCSLTLPEGVGAPADLTEAALEELLTALALLREESALPLCQEELLVSPRPGERRWLFARSLQDLSDPAFFRRLAESGLTAVLTHPEGAEGADATVLALESLEGGCGK